jgi:DNA invertase Pin-like site-specific DNA recombinase
VIAGLGPAKAQAKVRGGPEAAVRPERAVRLKERGMSIRGIAAKTGVSAMTVQRICVAPK